MLLFFWGKNFRLEGNCKSFNHLILVLRREQCKANEINNHVMAQIPINGSLELKNLSDYLCKRKRTNINYITKKKMLKSFKLQWSGLTIADSKKSILQK